MSRTTGNFEPVVGQRPNLPNVTFPGFVQPETTAATIGGTPNSSVAAGPNHQLVQFNQSKNQGQIGYKLPEARCVWTAVPPGNQYQVGGRFNVVLLNDAVRTAAELALNVTSGLAIAGGTGTIVGLSGEDIN